jgi:hypothetical protein
MSAELPRRGLARRDGLSALLVALFWLLPIVWVGSTNKNAPWQGRVLSYQQRCACLFTDAVTSWSTYHIQVQRTGDDAWIEVDERGMFDMPVFGYRTRFNRLLDHSQEHHPRSNERLAEAADFVKAHLLRLEPQASLTAVRFVRVWHPIGALAKETGRFAKRPLDLARAERQAVFFERRYDGKPAARRPVPLDLRDYKRRLEQRDRLDQAQP